MNARAVLVATVLLLAVTGAPTIASGQYLGNALTQEYDGLSLAERLEQEGHKIIAGPIRDYTCQWSLANYCIDYRGHEDQLVALIIAVAAFTAGVTFLVWKILGKSVAKNRA